MLSPYIKGTAWTWAPLGKLLHTPVCPIYGSPRVAHERHTPTWALHGANEILLSGMLGVSPICLILLRHYYLIGRQCVNDCSSENTWKGQLKTKMPSIWQFCRNDNLQCHQLRQSCQIGDLCYQWDGYKHVAAVSFIASYRRSDVVKLMEQGQISIFIGAYTKHWW